MSKMVEVMIDVIIVLPDEVTDSSIGKNGLEGATWKFITHLRT